VYWKTYLTISECFFCGRPCLTNSNIGQFKKVKIIRNLSIQLHLTRTGGLAVSVAAASVAALLGSSTSIALQTNTLQLMLKQSQLECGPMPNLMAALPNIGGALCSTPQSLADAHY